MPPEPPADAGSHPPTVFFLSDYGRRDEFVGVVHAVLRRLAPEAGVIDLTHEVPPFDVRAGARTLARTAPHLGSGVVLAVVDPGVGGGRRGLVVVPSGAPLPLVGPDNGLLVPAAEALGGLAAAFALDAPPEPPRATTFDGRDVLAPAAAALCRGADPADLGSPVPPAELVRVPPPVVERAAGGIGAGVRAEVTWVDHFGNVQLAARPADLPPALARTDGGPVTVRVRVEGTYRGPDVLPPLMVHQVSAFSDLAPGQLGLLVDANGHLALVMAEASASAALGAVAGDLVELSF